MRTILGSFGVLAVTVASVIGCGEDSQPSATAYGGSANGGGSGGTAGTASGGMSTGGSGEDAGDAASDRDGSGGAGADGGDAAGGSDGGMQLTSSKLDVLLVIDNSRSMADKQQVLDRSAKTLVSRLTNPRCLNAQGNPVTAVPPSPEVPCPDGSTRELTAVRDMHIGVITTSLGGHGADTCSIGDTGNWNPTQDDHARLLTRTSIATYQNRGYLVWDPNQTQSPPGESDAAVLAAKLAGLVVGAGEVGCGFEAPLEAWYRFLIDPEPPESVVLESSLAVLKGVDQMLLTQRSQFLRPDSAVLIVMLTDENDCSIVDGGISWIAGQSLGTAGSQFVLPKATSACNATPNGPCCRSCNTAESAAPSGCQPVSADPNCAPPTHTDLTDPLNVRCYEQKRRFGVDFLYPIERYVRGLTSLTVPNRAGQEVQNPLFSGQRDPSLITVAGIVGVPWQDLARDPADTGELRYLSAAELAAKGRWPVLAGDPARGTPPLDPFMRESVDPRSGTNPVTGHAIEPPTASTAFANPINGHEFTATGRDELQYACIFLLLKARDCAAVSSSCDCSSATGQPTNRPICQAANGSYGTTQYFAKAYPGLRELDLLSRLGERSVTSSICPRNLAEPDQADYAYAPAVGAIVDRMKHIIKP